ncbi:hypothetical protein Hanom_Chr08g00724641 [Helianthus anomalus]
MSLSASWQGNRVGHVKQDLIDFVLSLVISLETCKAASSMENAENNDVTLSNMHNSKSVEFWISIQISNVQLEQYCAVLLYFLMTRLFV